MLTPTLEQFKSRISHQDVRDWDLANSWESKKATLCWPEAVQYLAESGCAFEGALSEACFHGDIDMVRALLRTTRLAIKPVDIDAAFRAKSMDILLAVVEELVARRRTLCKIAKDIMKPADLIQLCLAGEASDVPNDKVEKLFELVFGEYHAALTSALRSFPLPRGYVNVVPELTTPTIDERNGVARLRAVSLFCDYDFLTPTELKENYIQKIEYLLNAGFHGLEEPGANGETVLYRTCRSFNPSNPVHETSFIWLLSHSKEHKFPPKRAADHRQLAGPIYYVASFLRHVDVASLQDVGILGPLKSIPTDNCKCFCARAGCMPHYMFLRCDGNSCRHRETFDACTAERYGIAARDGCLHQWCEAWQLSKRSAEQYYEEACRLEIFERLGMRHTCCAAGRRDNYSARIPDTIATLRARMEALSNGNPDLESENSWRRSDDAEREEIQSEDAELKGQLDLIMGFYALSRIKHPSVPIRSASDGDHTKSFWVLWWRTIDKFLPPVGREKCVYRGLDWLVRDMYQSQNLFQALDEEYPEKRRMEELRALDQAGACDESFETVIKQHLNWLCAPSFGKWQ